MKPKLQSEEDRWDAIAAETGIATPPCVLDELERRATCRDANLAKGANRPGARRGTVRWQVIFIAFNYQLLSEQRVSVLACLHHQRSPARQSV